MQRLRGFARTQALLTGADPAPVSNDDLLKQLGQGTAQQREAASKRLGELLRQAGGAQFDELKASVMGHLGDSDHDWSDADEPNYAARALLPVAERLNAGDIEKLKTFLSLDTGRVMGRAARTALGPEGRRELIEDSLAQLGAIRHEGASTTLEELADQLTRGDVRELQNFTQFHENHEVLLQVVRRNPEAQVRKAAAAGGSAGWAARAHGEALLEETAQGGNPEMRRLLSSIQDGSPTSDERVKSFQEHYQRLLKDTLVNAPKDSDMEHFRRLLQARQWAADPGQRNSGKISLEKVDQQLGELMQKPDVARQLESLRRQALGTAFGDIDRAVAAQEAYLQGPALAAKLKVLNPEERDQLLAGELGKLNLLSPSAAGAEVIRRLNEGIEGLPAHERDEARKDLRARLSPHGTLMKLDDVYVGVLPALKGRAATLLGFSGEVGMTGKVLGKLLGATGAVVDGVAAYDEFNNGDINGGIGKSASALGGLVFLGSTGVGLALVAGGLLFDWIFGESPEQTSSRQELEMLRDLGVTR